MKILQKLLLPAVAGFTMHAAVVGGITIDDNGYASTLIGSTGSFSTSGGTLASVLTDKDPGTYAFCFGGPTVCTVTLGFSSPIVNGSGADLAVFELGVPDPFQ